MIMKSCSILLALGVTTLAQGHDYYNVNIRDNNREGGIQVNLPDASSRTFEPTEGGKYVPPTQQVPLYPHAGQSAGGYERPSNEGSAGGHYNGQENTDRARHSNTRLTQITGADGSLIQSISHGDTGRQGNPSAAQSNTRRNVVITEQSTHRYNLRSGDKKTNDGWDRVNIYHNGKDKTCLCPKRT